MAHTPSRNANVRRWRRNLADELGEAEVYRALATRRSGTEKQILLELARAEGRHAAHWQELLGPDAKLPPRTLRSRMLNWFARRFGSVFVLALVQRAESRSTYEADADATAQMAADERIHAEVVRSLAAQGRARMSGNFRAAVFGANDGLVSNLALILGIGASGVSSETVLLSGLAGLLAGALSMGAGEYVSVRSQRELAEASRPSRRAHAALEHLDVNANELALVYRARGLSETEAAQRAQEAINGFHAQALDHALAQEDEDLRLLGSAWSAAASSFGFFAVGAIIPVLPYLAGITGYAAVFSASALVAAALVATGATVGILSGTSPLSRAARQVAIGLGAAGATYLLGLAFGGIVA